MKCLFLPILLAALSNIAFCQGTQQPCIQRVGDDTNCRTALGLPNGVNAVLCGGNCTRLVPGAAPTCSSARDMKQRQPSASNPPIDLDYVVKEIPPYDPTKPAVRATTSGLINCGKIAQCMCTPGNNAFICSVDLNPPVTEVFIHWYGAVGTEACPVGDGGPFN